MLSHAQQSPGARNHPAGMLRSHVAFAIGARPGFSILYRSREQRPRLTFSQIPLDIIARACFEAIHSSRSLLEQAFMVFDHALVFQIPFEIVSLRIVHFELCFARVHRPCQVPYANLGYMLFVFFAIATTSVRNSIAFICFSFRRAFLFCRVHRLT